MRFWDQLPVSEWEAHLRANTVDQRPFFEAFVRGELDAHAHGEDPVRWDRRLGRIAGAVELDDYVEYEVLGPDERATRRWCWAEGWVLLEQDEDLLLMSMEQAPWLLEEAALGCPKAAYAVGIVVHWIRDRAHHSLFPRNRSEPHDAVLADAERLIALAERTDPEAAAYFRRLASYRQRRPVAGDEVRQRVYDLRRCHPSPTVDPVFRREGKRWVAKLDFLSTQPGELVIHAGTGQMEGRELG